MSIFGIGGLVKEPGAVYKIAQDGFATYDKTVSGIFESSVPFSQGDPAEEWPNVVLMTIEVHETGKACDHVELKLHYEGKDFQFVEPGSVAQVNVDFTVSQEPIESHPDFVDQIGGIPSAPLHGAIFDTTGEFVGFPVVDPDEPDQLPSRFASIRTYNMPQETYTSSTVETEYPTPGEIASIGRVFEPTVSLPTLPGNRSWLNTGIRVSNIANVYFRTQRTGLLSGPRNWLPEAYGTV